MKHSIVLRMAAVAAALLFAFATSGLAQESKPVPPLTPPHISQTPGTLFVPKSSQPQTVPAGHKFAARTNVQIFVPSGLNPDEAPPFPGYGYETPASAACHYGLVADGALAPNCDPNTALVSPTTGGSNTIAIVDAYDDPSAPGDLAWFSLQFGIPLSLTQFHVAMANTASSSCPANFGYSVPIDATGGWEVEESLDIEWSHAMAPKANIYLVEACSSFDSDLQQAVLLANNIVQCPATAGVAPNFGVNPATGALIPCPAGSKGVGEVSMSWGAGEFVGENASDACATADDSCFTTPGVVYFASSGDGPGVIWPGASANVVSAGGTTIERKTVTTPAPCTALAPCFPYEREAAWVFGGGGDSSIELIPSYQKLACCSVASIVGKWRGVPDLSFDADPYTGVYVYDTFPIEGFYYYEWLAVGGTSVSSPSLAGIVNNASGQAGHVFAASSNAELTTIYTNKATVADFTDITYGFCGFYMGLETATGWDFCTGVGVPHTYAGK